MPLHLPKHFPAIERLKQENILVERGEEETAHGQVEPIKIAVLNLMPTKLQTETDILRLLSASPLDIEVAWMRLRSHTPTHVPAAHMDAYYHYFDELASQSFDGLIVTGAPVEHLDFEEVDYWDELTQIFSWARTSLKSTLYICWAAQAGLYFHEGINKYALPKKMFGIFPQQVLHPEVPIFRGFDDVFRMPHSRHTEIRKEDILQHPELSLLAESEESGVSMCMTAGGKEIFITGHMEYAPDTLDQEYHRDAGKRDDVDLPRHYYRDDNPAKGPLVTWRAHAHLLFTNWMNEYLR
ncbi:homoserine O-succinyltransferase [Prevotella sp. BV3P1]|uniref:homoserine O-succinyltransferase n=1 Tax=Prevotellaceae TaxID=171552 RepID=UPI0003B81D39|nr:MULTISPECIES: homoserine O-succinyltransferase [Prevotellaceae]ERT61354.1 homoserine O-succinyltransferase [Prevotella sp. BV3P1]KGF41355.1 homoserine O-succinyltransferase [Hoylesella buccalis DNF00985]